MNDDSESAFPNEAWIGIAAGIALIVVVLAVMVTCLIRKRSVSVSPVYSKVQRKASLTAPSPAYAATPGAGGDTLPLPGGYGWGTMDAEGAGATLPGYRQPGFDVPDGQASQHSYSDLSLRPGNESKAYSNGRMPTAARIYLTSTPPSSGVSTRTDVAGAGVPLYADVRTSFVNQYTDSKLLESKSKQ